MEGHNPAVETSSSGPSYAAENVKKQINAITYW